MRCWPVIAFGVLLACPAMSAPPPVGSDDYKIMMPYKDWITSQHDRLGRYCCDIGDGRPTETCVQVRRPIDDACHPDPQDTSEGDAHYWVHITKAHWPDEPERWMVVPDERVIQNANPMGVDVVWIYRGLVQCFAPSGGV